MTKTLKTLGTLFLGVLMVLALGANTSKAETFNDLTVKGDATFQYPIYANGSKIQFGGGDLRVLDFASGNSKIYQQGDLHVATDDNIYFDFSNASGSSMAEFASRMRVNDNLYAMFPIYASGNEIVFNGSGVAQKTADGTPRIYRNSDTLRLMAPNMNLDVPGTVTVEADLTVGDDLIVTDAATIDGTLSLGTGTITDSTGTISFGNEALTTTGAITGATGTFASGLLPQVATAAPSTALAEGALYYNSTSNGLFMNTGTAASPTWTALAASSVSLDTAYENGSTVTVDVADVTWNLSSTLDFVIQDNGVAMFTVSDGGALDFDGAGAVSLDADAASNFNTSAGDITVDSEAGSVNIDGGEAAADAVNIDASNVAGGIDIDAGTGGVAIDSTGVFSVDGVGASNVTTDSGNLTLSTTTSGDLNVSAAAELDLDGATTVVMDAGTTMTLTGGTAASLIATTGDANVTASAGSVNVTGVENAADSIVISSTNGGIDITTASTEDIDMTGTGGINIASSETAAGALSLQATGSHASTTLIINSAGTSASALDVDSAGGMSFVAVGGAGLDTDLSNTNGSINITAGEDAANAIVLTSAGGIDLSAAGTAGQDIDIANTGGSVNITATENIANAIVITADDGGVGTAAGIDMTAEGSIDITNTGASGSDITISSTSGSINISGGEAIADAVEIDASNAAGGIDIDAGTGGIAIDSTGAISIDGVGASNVTTDTGNLTISTTTSGSLILTGAGLVDLNAGANLDIDVTGNYTMDSTGTFSVDGVGASNITTDTGALTVSTTTSGDLNLTSASSVVVTGAEAAADAIYLNASAGGVDITAATNDIDLLASTLDVNITGQVNTDLVATTGNVSLTATAEDVTANSGDDILLTATDEFDATSTGLMDLNAGANLDTDVTGNYTMDSTGTFSVDGVGASNITTDTGALTVSTTTSGSLILDGVALVDLNAGANLDIDVTGTYDMLSSGAFSIDGTGASNVTAATGDLTVSATANSVVIDGGEAAADAVNIDASAGGIDIDAVALYDVAIDGGQVLIGSKDDVASAIALTTNVGTSETIVVTNTQGTSANAITLAATAGGVNIDAAATLDVAIDGGQVLIGSKDDVASAIALTTNQGTSETIVVTNTQGTSESAITLAATAGGVNIDAAATKDVDLSGGQLLLSSKDNVASAIALTTNVGTSETIVVTNTQGTGVAAIDLTATAGGITATAGLASADALNLNASAGGVDVDAAALYDVDIAGGQVALSSKDDTASAISLTTNQGTSETIVVTNTQGTSESAITLASTAGGVNIDAAATKDVAIDGGQVLIGSKDDVASAIALTTNVGTSETIVVTNTQGTSANAITLAATAGGVNIDAAATLDVAIDGGQVLIGSKDDVASAIALTTNQGTSETIVVTNTQGTGAAAIDINATAGGIEMDAAAAKIIDLETGAAGSLYFGNDAVAQTVNVGTGAAAKTVTMGSTNTTSTTTINGGSGGILLDGPVVGSGPDTITNGSVAISVLKLTTLVDSSGGVIAATIADGINGQIKVLTMVVAGNAMTLDNTNLNGTSLVLDAVGEAATLVFDSTTGKWSVSGTTGTYTP